MKSLLYFCITLFTLLLPTSCHSRQETTAESATDSLSTDSIDSTTTDTIKITEMPTPPKKADEYFDDFMFAFMKNPRFQRSRITFPLSHTIDGRTQKIEAKQWKFTPMYAQREVYTLIFDHHKGMKMAKDTSIAQVLVEDIDLNQQRVKSYLFAKEKGEWQLKSLNETPTAQSHDREFYLFYHRFANDAHYREQHLNNPLQFVTFDEDNFRPIEGVLAPSQWKDFAPELPTQQLTNIHYEQQKTNSPLRLLNISTLSGGMSSTLTFKRIKGEWILVKLEN